MGKRVPARHHPYHRGKVETMSLKKIIQTKVTREITDWKLAGREQARIDALGKGATLPEASRQAIARTRKQQ